MALDDRIRDILRSYPSSPGLAAAIVRDDDVIWKGSFGYADIEARIAMTPSTILNVGSVTKTVTATAILQLVEDGHLALDRDISTYLPFPIRNPAHPDIPIHVRDLLVHRSSVLDDDRYEESYVCGDQRQLMRSWLASYFDKGANPFHPWTPGTENPPEEPRPYSNVAYGILGLLVEMASGMPYHQYFREHIFQPLGMDATGFLLSEIDRERHAVPYSSRDADVLPRSDQPSQTQVDTGYRPHCLYSFATPTDGLMRTSAQDLCRFLSLYTDGGLRQGKQLIAPSSIEIAFPPSKTTLTWWRQGEDVSGGEIWFHGGSDPGISSLAAVLPEQRLGFAIIQNSDDDADPIDEVFFSLLEWSSVL